MNSMGRLDKYTRGTPAGSHFKRGSLVAASLGEPFLFPELAAMNCALPQDVMGGSCFELVRSAEPCLPCATQTPDRSCVGGAAFAVAEGLLVWANITGEKASTSTQKAIETVNQCRIFRVLRSVTTIVYYRKVLIFARWPAKNLFGCSTLGRWRTRPFEERRPAPLPYSDSRQASPGPRASANPWSSQPWRAWPDW